MKRILSLLLALLVLGSGMALAEEKKEPDLVHFLVLGFDFWGDETIGVSYSDTNILASIDRANGRLMITSLLRDTYVEKPDGTWGRLNNTVRDEGFDVMLETVSKNYGVDVDIYMAIGVKGMRRLLDQLGTVEVTLTSSEAEALKDHVSGVRGKGTYQLKSSGVMHYMRLRKIAGHDIGRTERQRKVLTQVFLQISQMNLSEMTSLGMALLDELETNINLQQMMQAINDVYTLRDKPLETMYLPIDGAYENVTRHGMAVYELDWEKNRQALQDFLNGDLEPAAAE